MDENLLSIQEAAKKLKTSTKTLRRWEERGILVPQRTTGAHRRYTNEQIEKFIQDQKAKKILSRFSAVTRPAPLVLSAPYPEGGEGLREGGFYPDQTSIQASKDFIAQTQNKFTSNKLKDKLSNFTLTSAQKIVIMGSFGSLACLILFVLTLRTFPIAEGLFGTKSDVVAIQKIREEQSVLAASTAQQKFVLNVNVPATFMGKANFLNGLEIDGRAVLAAGDETGSYIDLGTGTIIASNIIYSVNGGDGISVTPGQDPIITNTGVLSLGGQSGAVSLTAGSGISISGNTITNTSPDASQDTFKNVLVGSDTLTAGSSDDTLTFVAGSGISLTGNTSDKSITITSIGGITSPWQQVGGVVSLVDPSGVTTINMNPLNGAGEVSFSIATLSVNGETGVTEGSPSCVTTTNGVVTGTGICQLGSEQWVASNGTLYPGVSSYDLIIGGTSTTSAKFAVLNMAGGTPIASLSGTTNGVALGGDGSVQSIRNGTLTIGGNTTGNIALRPSNGTGTVSIGSLIFNAQTGAVTAGIWNGTVISTQYGGTGQDFSATAQGSLPYFSATGTLAALAPSTAGFVLITNGPGSNPTWVDPSVITNNFWNSANGALYPKITSQDFLLGGPTTTSAKFAVLNMNTGTPTASIAGNISLSGGSNTIGTNNSDTLALGSSTTGSIVISPSGVAAITAIAGGNVGIGTSNPSSKLDVQGGIRLGAAGVNNVLSTTIGGGSPTGDLFWGSRTICDNSGNCAGTGAGIGGSGTANRLAKFTSNFDVGNSSINDLNSGGVALTIDATGNIGVGTGTPTGLFNVQGAPPGQALAVFNYTGSGQNIITASASGVSVFNVDQNGNVILASGASYEINGISVLSSNALGSGVTTSSLTTVGALANGSIISGFGTITTANSITGSVINGTSGVNTGAGAGTNRIDAAGNLVNIGTISSTYLSTSTNVVNLAASTVLQMNGTTVIDASRNLTNINTTQFGGLTYTWPGSQSGGYVLQTNGSGILSWVDPAVFAGINYWDQANGLLNPKNSTVDFAIGGSSTTSALFAITGVNAAAPTATLSARTNGNGIALSASSSTIQSLNNNTLTIGGATTGNVIISPIGGNGITFSTGSLSIASTKTYQINQVDVLSSTTLGASVVNSSLTSVGNLSSGSIVNGFGTITTANTITGSTLNGTTGINTGVGAGTARIDAAGNLVNIGTTQIHGITYTWPGADAIIPGYVLSSNGSGGLSWIDVSTATTAYWDRTNGALYPRQATVVDLLLGGTSTASAKFGFINNNSGTPTATISANLGDNATYLTGNGNLGTANGQTLSLGGISTGNITLTPLGGNGVTTNNGTFNLASGKTYQINGVDVLSSTTLGSSVINSSLTSVGTITTGIWHGTAIAAQYGGTGINTSASTGVPYITGGTWSVDSNFLSVAHGGTGVNGSSAANGAILIGNGTGFALNTLTAGNGINIANGSGTITISSIVDSFWAQTNGSLYPYNSTVDFLIGGQSSASAKFAVLNVNSGTPTASVSGATGSSYLTAAGNIGTSNFQTLTLGGATTGNITLNPNGGTGITNSTGTFNLASGKTYQINGVDVLSSTTLGSSVINSSLTSVGNLSSGSIVNGFGTITTANTITGSTLNGTTGINTGVGAGTARIDAAGNLVNIGTTQIHGITYTWPGADAIIPGYVLSSNGSGGLSWIDVSTATTAYWDRTNGALYPRQATVVDLLLGGTSTASAKFGFINNNSGTPTATISANTGGGAAYLTGTGILGTANGQSLTIGSPSTGNIILNGFTGNNGVVFAAPTGVLGEATTNTSGQCLMSSGSPFAPSWQACPGSGSGASKWTLSGNIIYPNGINQQIGIGTQSTAEVISSFYVTHDLASGALGKSVAIFNQTENQDILTASASGTPVFTVAQNGNLRLIDGSGSNYATITVSNLAANKAYNLPTYSGSTADICLSTGNCAGAGGGITGSGSINRVAKFTSSGSVGDSSINDLYTGGVALTFGTLGNVGIGTITPVGLFNVNGNVSGQALAVLNYTGSGQNIIAASASGATVFTLDESGNVNIANGAAYSINNTSVLSSTTLGASVVNSSLTSVGTIGTGIWHGTAVGSQYGGTGVNTSASTGVPYISSGTWSVDSNFLSVNHGGTGVGTLATNGILFGNGTSPVQVTAASANSILVTDGSNIPSLSQTLPTAVQDNITRLGTIVSGVWNGTLIGTQYGGTGQNFAGTAQGSVPYFSASGVMAALAPSTAGYVLSTNGAGANPSWVDSSSVGTNYWTLNNGAIEAKNSTVDFLLGGQATSSALFGVVGINNGAPVATISASTNGNGLSLSSSNSTLQALNNNTLAIGGNTTGAVSISPSNGSGNLALNIGSLAVNGVAGITQGAASCVTTTNGIVTGFGSCQLGSEQWNVANGAIYTGNPTLDLLLGGTATSSSKFAFINVSGGTPTASISAGTTGDNTFLTGNGNLGTTSFQTLTLGGATTGNITISPNGGTGVTTNTGTFNLATGKTYQINGVDILSNTTLGASVVNSSLTSVGALTSGSIATGFGSIVTNNPITGTSLNGTTGLNTGASSGTQRIDASGNLVNIGTTQFNGQTYTWPVGGQSIGYILTTDGAGSLSWAPPAGGTNWWNETNGALYPFNPTVDFLLGGSATASAKFAVLNIAGGTPTASVSAGTSGGAYLSATGNLATTAFQTLSLGGATTGNIVLNPNAGSGVVSSTGTLNLAVNKTYQINGVDVLSNTTLGASVVNSSLTSVGTIVTGIWHGTVIGTQYGGTGQDFSAIVQGSLPYFNGTGTMAALAPGNVNYCLTSGGSGANPIWQSCAIGAGTNYLQLNNNLLSPNNSTYDFAIGGTSTDSANFAVLNNAGGTPTATVAGNLILFPKTSGSNELGGNLGIGTTNPTNAISILTNGSNAFVQTSNGTATAVYGVQANSVARLGTTTNNSFEFITNNTTRFKVDNTGLIGLGTTSPISELHVTRSLTEGAIGKALAIFDQMENQDILTASAGGTTRFRVQNTGELTFGDNNSSFFGTLDLATLTGNRTYTFPDASGTVCISTNNCGFALGSNFWQLNNNLLSPSNSTYDFAIGGTSTSSAKFAVLNVAGGTPTASISANTGANGTYLSGLGNLATTNFQTLTFGGTTTGLSKFLNSSGNPFATFDPFSNGLYLGAQGSMNGLLTFYSSGGGTAPSISADSSKNLNITAPSGTVTLGNGTGDINLDPGSGNLVANLSAIGDFLIQRAGTTFATFSHTGNEFLLNGGTTGGQAVAIFNQGGAVTNDIFAASASGTTRFRIQNTGELTFGDNNSAFFGTLDLATLTGNRTYTFPDASGTVCLSTNNCGFATGSNFWQLNNNLLSPSNSTYDFAVGGTASSTAKFVVLNVAGGTPTASLSAGTSGGAYLTAAGNLSTTANQTLTIGGATTGNVSINNNLFVTGHSVFGSDTTAIDPDRVILASETFTNTSGSKTGIRSVVTANPSADSTSGYFGNSSRATTTNGLTFDVSQLTGYSGTAVHQGVAGSTIGNAYGFIGQISNTNTGDITNASVFQASNAINSGGGSIANAYEFWGDYMTNGTNKYGLYLSDSVAGPALTGNFGIYSETDYQNVLVGNTRIGANTIPTVTLDVTGQGLFTATNKVGVSPAILTVTGGIANNAALIVNNNNNGDLFVASTSGATKFKVGNTGLVSVLGGLTSDIDTLTGTTLSLGGTTATTLSLGRSGQGITLPGFTTNNNTVLTTNGSGVLSQVTTTTSGQCLVSNAAGNAPSWATCPGGSGFTQWNLANGAIFSGNSTLDLLLGGSATASAKFAVLNMNSGTPTASVSAGTAGGAYINATGTLATTAKQTLTLGDANTGNIILNPSGTSKVGIGNSAPTAALDILSTTPTGNTVAIANNSLTTGTALNISSTSQMTSGSLLALNNTTTYSSPIANSGNGINLARALTVNIAASNPTIDASSSASTNPASSATWSHTVGNGSGRYLVVAVDIGNTSTTVTGVTYDSVAMTQLGTTTGSTSRVYLFGLVNPNSGTHNVVASYSGSAFTKVGASSWTNVDQSNPTGTYASNTTTATSTTTNVSSSSTDMVVDTYAIANQLSPTPNAGVNQAVMWNDGVNVSGGGSYKTGSTTTTAMTWSHTNNLAWTQAGVALHASTTTGLDLSGALASFSSNCLITTGACNDTSNILSLTQSYARATGAALNIANAGFGVGLNLNSNSGGQSALVVNKTGSSGDIFTASASGTTKFKVDLSGNLSFAGGQSSLLTLAFTAGGAQTITFPNATGTVCLSTNNCGFAVGNFWQLNSNLLSPSNSTYDFAIGGTSTSSAKFAVLNVAGGTPTASVSAGTSGGTYLTATGNLATTANQTLSLGGSTTGLINLLNSSGNPFATFNPVAGTLGLGTTSSLSPIGIIQNSATSTIYAQNFGGNTTIALANDVGREFDISMYPSGSSPANAAVLNQTYNAPLRLMTNNTARLDILGNGSLGLGTTAPISQLQVTRPLSFGANGTALAIFDQIENQDILTASAGGTTRFRIQNTGELTFGDNNSTFFGTLDLATLTGNRTYTFPNATGTVCLDTNNCGFAVGNFWQLNSNLLSPSNSTYDFAIGGTSTSSAKFAVLNVAGGTPTASISANSGSNALFLTGAGNISTTNNQTLTFGGASNGSIKFVNTSGATSLNIRNNQTVAIGADSDPLNWATFYVNGGFRADDDFRFQKASGTQYISRINQAGSGGASGYDLTFQVRGDNIAMFGAGGLVINNSADSNNYFQVKSSQQANSLYVTGNTGNLGLGTSTPTSQLYVTRPLASGANGKALAVFDQIENQDILSASAAGTTRFTISNNGDITQNSGEATGTAYALNANSLTSGTAHTISSTSITTGKLAQFTTGAANTFTSGTLLDLRSTTTAMTGSLGTGSLLNLDWSPGSATTATGDLFALNIGANGTTTGNLFNILSGGSSLFSISQTAVTSNLPVSLNAAGDISAAYDLSFTNPTASFIKSSAPLTLASGEIFNSSNLTLQTYNWGQVDLEASGGIIANVNQGGVAAFAINNSGNGDLITASASGTTKFRIANSGDVTIIGSTTTCTLGNGSSTTSCSASDQRLKTNINNLPSLDGLDAVMALNPVSFNWNQWMQQENGATPTQQFGFIAQEVQTVLPNLVAQDVNTGFYKLDYQGLFAPIIKAIQQQQVEINNLGQLSSPNFDHVTAQTVDAGSVNVSTLVAVNASVSGILTANTIHANTLELPRAAWQEALSNGALEDITTSVLADGSSIFESTASADLKFAFLDNKISSVSANIDHISQVLADLNIAGFATDSGELTSIDNLMVAGTTTLAEASISNNLTVGNDLTLTSNSINTVNNDLEIQPLNQAGINFLGGKITFDTDGNINVSGNLAVTGDVTVGGVLAAHDVAVGRADITELSDTEIVATGSSGLVTLKSGETELKIDNAGATQSSLIFLTPKTASDLPIYIKSQNDGDFTVGIKQAQLADIKFNFLIVK